MPVGAAVVIDGVVVSRAHNETIAKNDLTQHAELIAIQRALEKLHSDRLDEATLYVTLEPCAMCAGAIVLARMGALVYGARDPKAGACGSLLDVPGEARLNHNPPVTPGILEEECAGLLRQFFERRR